MRKENWEELSEEKFREVFKNSAVKRTKYPGLMRNTGFLRK
jgi:epoxyqueuosine reductase